MKSYVKGPNLCFTLFLHNLHLFLSFLFTDTWHQFDDVMQTRPEANKKNNWNKFVASLKSTFGVGDSQTKEEAKKVSRLVHDRELAVLQYLPKWQGLTVSDSPTPMKPREAIKLVQQVWNWTVQSKVTHNCSPKIFAWIPDGFHGNEVRIFVVLLDI